MPFKKGISGNPAGPVKRRTVELEPTNRLNEKINKYLEKNFDTIFCSEDGLKTSAGRESARIYCELLKYSVPRLAPKRSDIKLENLTNEQLQEIIETLQDNADKSTFANLKPRP